MLLLPTQLAPPAPFPIVTRTVVAAEFVAPGVTRADYRLLTVAGPFAITAVVVDPREPTVRLRAVLAHDRLVSDAETLTSMASRTRAVAGINADYFDINGTNQPLNIVVRDGLLVRSPSRRAAIAIGRDGEVRFGHFTLNASAAFADGGRVPITGVNTWPPEGGASLVTPAYGTLPPAGGVTLAELEPEGSGATYRVRGVAPASAAAPATLALALGPAALALHAAPAPGDAIAIDEALQPPLGEIETALGGGPLLVQNGGAAVDPAPPAPEETNRRFPVAGAFRRRDGSLVLIAVDGRRPDRSIGATRPEFGALMRGLGASDGMAFDSGGSAEVVARVLGEPNVSVRNDPSDGTERPIADALVVQSTAPQGPPSRLVVRPAELTMLAGARAVLRAAVTDAAGHALQPNATGWHARVVPSSAAILTRSTGTLTAGSGPANADLVVTGEGLAAHAKIRVVDRAARVAIVPARPNPDPGSSVRLEAIGEDASGKTVIVDGATRWSVRDGTISPEGLFRAGTRDAIVTASAGGAHVTTRVLVGRHPEPFADVETMRAWTFSTVPARGPGAVNVDSVCGCLALTYDFRGDERAAYAHAALALPGEPREIALDLDGDGSGVGLRTWLSDRYGTRRPLTLARAITWTNWKRVSAQIPSYLVPPIQLESLYAVATLGTGRVRSAGTLRIRNATAIVAGSGTNRQGATSAGE